MDSESFLSRWSKRKIDNNEEPQEQVKDEVIEPEKTVEQEQFEELSDTSIAQSDETEDTEKPESIASLLASQAAKETKKAALRKLFLSGEFSEVDRLNDYDHDYSSVKPLATEVAQQLRQWWNNSTDESEEETLTEEVMAEPLETDVESETEGELLVSDERRTDETKNPI